MPARAQQWLKDDLWDIQEAEFQYLPTQQFGTKHRSVDLLTSEMAPVEVLIKQARALTALPGDFDDNGGVAVAETAWLRAGKFLRETVGWLVEKTGAGIALPVVGVGPDGSIDLHWESDDYELLVNIEANGKGSFYGDDKTDNTVIRGSIDSESGNLTLLSWILVLRQPRPSRS